MSAISTAVGTVLKGGHHLLNTPGVKQKAKDVLSITSAVTACYGLRSIWQIYKNPPVSAEPKPWKEVVKEKIRNINTYTTISFCSTILVSRVAVSSISAIAARVASDERLTRMFGPNTTFAVNPKHPRHLANLAALIFLAPTFIQLGLEKYKNRNAELNALKEQIQAQNSFGGEQLNVYLQIYTLTRSKLNKISTEASSLNELNYLNGVFEKTHERMLDIIREDRVKNLDSLKSQLRELQASLQDSSSSSSSSFDSAASATQDPIRSENSEITNLMKAIEKATEDNQQHSIDKHLSDLLNVNG